MSEYNKEDIDIEMSWLISIDFDNEKNIKRAAIEILEMKDHLRNQCPKNHRICPYED